MTSEPSATAFLHDRDGPSRSRLPEPSALTGRRILVRAIQPVSECSPAGDHEWCLPARAPSARSTRLWRALAAARAKGLKRSTLNFKLKKLGIEPAAVRAGGEPRDLGL